MWRATDEMPSRPPALSRLGSASQDGGAGTCYHTAVWFIKVEERRASGSVLLHPSLSLLARFSVSFPFVPA